jgi:TonB family protein
VNRLLVAVTAIGIVLAVPHPAYASRPACSSSIQAPRLATSATFEKSQIVIDEGLRGTANVLVTIDDNGVVQRASVVSSTGNGLLDSEALRVAKTMRFAPQTACPAIAGSYSVVVDFTD